MKLEDIDAEMLVVTENQVVAAMRHYEQQLGKGDGVAIPRPIARLADLLGAMWFDHEKCAQLPTNSSTATLIRESGALDAGDGTPDIASSP